MNRTSLLTAILSFVFLELVAGRTRQYCNLIRCGNRRAPVCGENGVTYRSMCHFIKTVCLGKEPAHLRVKRQGSCNDADIEEESTRRIVGNMFRHDDIREYDDRTEDEAKKQEDESHFERGFLEGNDEPEEDEPIEEDDPVDDKEEEDDKDRDEDNESLVPNE